jgi:hypothetical protein
MTEFNDITLINNNDSPIIAKQKKMMNDDVEIILDRVYKDGFDCICGKNVKIVHKHINSSKHKRFVDKHNIHIEIIQQPVKPKKIKKPKGPRGRPRKYDYDKNETPEETKERKRKYMVKYFDDNEDKRIKHNEKVTEYRVKNRDKCREAVKRCRAKKRELDKLKEV